MGVPVCPLSIQLCTSYSVELQVCDTIQFQVHGPLVFRVNSTLSFQEQRVLDLGCSKALSELQAFQFENHWVTSWGLCLK